MTGAQHLRSAVLGTSDSFPCSALVWACAAALAMCVTACGDPDDGVTPPPPPDAARCPERTQLDFVRVADGADAGVGEDAGVGGDADAGAGAGAGEQLILTACADLAITEAERREGLRGAPPLAAGEALLIVFPLQLDDICIVNNGVSFSIDVLIIDGEGVVTAREPAIPADDGTPRCHDGVRWVAELAAGQADAVKVGDRLRIDGVLGATSRAR